LVEDSRSESSCAAICHQDWEIDSDRGGYNSHSASDKIFLLTLLVEIFDECFLVGIDALLLDVGWFRGFGGLGLVCLGLLLR